MNDVYIKGGKRLFGEVYIPGAKNSVLPILAATVLTGKTCILHNCPQISDVNDMLKILESIGAKTLREGRSISVDASGIDRTEIDGVLMETMRSSVLLMGPLLSRFGKCRVTAPGGCNFCTRPIDLHLKSLETLGTKIVHDRNRHIICTAGDGLTGQHISLALPSVGATENTIMAAVTAHGRTIIHNAAMEPEIADLAMFLNACGASVVGGGESTVVIDGTKSLTGCEFSVMPDRIAAATYLCAAAGAGGKIVLKGANPSHICTETLYLTTAGCDITFSGDEVILRSNGQLNSPGKIETYVYPGFPTDSASPFLSIMTKAKGVTMFVENVFPERYKYVDELKMFGARINVKGEIAVVEGVDRLVGCTATATDLRGGAAVIIAALMSDGESRITNMGLIERGYENITDALKGLGADIEFCTN